MLIHGGLMAKDSPREKPRGKSVAQAARQRMYVHLVVLLLILGAIAVGVLFLLQDKHTGAPSTAPRAAKESAPALQSKGGFDRLKGRWQRPDGGYVIEVRDIDVSGKMAAGHFNPRSINVSQAQAALDGKTLKVFIELRDVNYPGATYNLTLTRAAISSRASISNRPCNKASRCSLSG